MAQRFIDNTLFSGFWAYLSDDRKALLYKLSFKDALTQIRHSLAFANPDPNTRITKTTTQTAILNYFDNFVRDNTTLLNDMVQDLKAGKYTIQTAIKNLVQVMLNNEIETNRKRQFKSKNVNSVDNRKKIIENHQMIFSTIHSVKGLEFDNVILYMSTDHIMEDESMKRLYYVGLTRAKNSELVLDVNHYSLDDSLMLANYKEASKNFN